MTPASAVVSPLTPAPRTPGDLQGWSSARAGHRPGLAPRRVGPGELAVHRRSGQSAHGRVEVTTAACDAVVKAREQRCQICSWRSSTVTSTRRNSRHLHPGPAAAFPGIAAGRCIVVDEHSPSRSPLSLGLVRVALRPAIRYRRLHPGAGVRLEQWGTTIARPRGLAEGCLVGRCGEALQTVADSAATTIGGGSKTRPRTLTPSGLPDRARSCAPPVLAAAAAPDAAVGVPLRAAAARHARREIDPPSFRATVRVACLSGLVGVDEATALAILTGKGINNESHAKSSFAECGRLRRLSRHQADRQRVWTGHRRRGLRPGPVRSAPPARHRRLYRHRERWLRDIVLTWARTTHPTAGR